MSTRTTMRTVVGRNLHETVFFDTNLFIYLFEGQEPNRRGCSRFGNGCWKEVIGWSLPR